MKLAKIEDDALDENDPTNPYNTKLSQLSHRKSLHHLSFFVGRKERCRDGLLHHQK